MEFYTKEAFKSWIQSYPETFYRLEEEEDNLRLVTDYAAAEVNFASIYEYEIVEMRIISVRTKEDLFYLHFDLKENSEARCHQLFEEMVHALKDAKGHDKTRVLLCCTGGLTTSYFAEKLNETSEYLKADYYFSAVSYSKLYETASAYDVILLAPQIRHRQSEVRSAYPSKPVYTLPTQIFSSYNAAACITFVALSLETAKMKGKEKEAEILLQEKVKHAGILSITFVSHWNPYYVFRVYKDGEMKKEVRLQKLQYDMDDILDAVHVAMLPEYEIEYISVCMPGEINGGTANVALNLAYMNRENIRQLLEEKMGLKVRINRTTSMAALGFHHTHPQYHTLTFHSQNRVPFAGQAYIINDVLYEGRKKAAGELILLLKRSEIEKAKNNPQGYLKYVSEALAKNIALMAPEAIAIAIPLEIPLEKIRAKLKKRLPEQFIPDLYLVSEEERMEYMHLGNVLVCQEEIRKNAEKENDHA